MTTLNQKDEQQLSYWRKRLQGDLPILQLPTDRPRQAVQTYRACLKEYHVTTELYKKTKLFIKRENVTLDVLLLTLFKTLLHRYTGQDDLVVGVGRSANTIAIRTDLADAMTFAELLEQVDEHIRQAAKNSDVPFRQLIEELQIEEDSSYSPIFQAMFRFLTDPVENAVLERESFDFPCDLSLVVRNDRDDLNLSFVYNSELFDHDTIMRMTGHLQMLLEGAVADTSASITQLPMLTAKERHQLLEEWNETDAEYPQDRCVHHLFEEQAQLTPHAIALEYADQCLTYEELNHRANQLAHHLRSLGVGSEMFVALCAEKSLEMMIGLLAILKAGAAYMPLDPMYPQDRLEHMLSDSKATVLLIQQHLVDLLPPHNALTVYLDAEWDKIAGHSIANLDSGVKPEHPIFLTYTSGSTGKPKGVVNLHKSLMNHNIGIIKKYRLKPSDRHLQFHSISWDLAFEEFFPCWLAGATVVLRTEEWLDSTAVFLRMIDKKGITALNLPTAYWHELVHELSASPSLLPACLRFVVVGGEKPSAEHYQTWRKITGSQVLWMNGYGPTEAAITTTLYEPPLHDDQWQVSAELPIGVPAANTKVYLLDKHMNPVPIGVPGEMYIGGVCVSRGYLNNPELTDEKFVPNIFSHVAGDRLYRTGDLVRYRPDRNIEFLGRVDHQVKIRGFRVELGEIETVLGQHEAVREVVVLAREGSSGSKRLVAYLVVHDGQEISTSELRAYAKQVLPDYMVPSAFVKLLAFPLTPNGKVDRRALPDPQEIQMEQQAECAAPRNEMEEQVAAIWERVLGVARVGIYDDFFELGGNSLLATQIVSQLRAAFQSDFTVRLLFEVKTVAELSSRIEHALTHGYEDGAIQPTRRAGNPPMSFAQQRQWFLKQLEPENTAYNIADRVQIQGALDIVVLEQALREIIRRHETLRTTFANEDGQTVQVIAPKGQVQLPIIDLSELSDLEQQEQGERWTIQEQEHPFDLAEGPLLRTTLLRMSDTEHLLFVTAHHIITDGWSMNVLYQELGEWYAAISEQRPAHLPDLPIQYADFAIWQRDHLQGDEWKRQLEYWTRQLADSPKVHQLPLDRPRPAVQTYSGARHKFTISQKIVDDIKKLGRQEGASLYMTLLTAFKTLLYRYSGSADLLVGTPIANRNRTEIEGLLGFFVNTLVIRTKPANQLSFREYLMQVREVALDSYAHQDMPFEKLVAEVQPERDLSHSPLFQVMFVLQNTVVPSLETSGLQLTPVETKSRVAQFDLTMFAEERPDGLEVSLEYKTDLFDEETILRMSAHFHNLLAAAVQEPDEAISKINLLTPEERHRLLVEWNDTAVSYPEGACFHHELEEQAAKIPDQVAIVCGDTQVTYGELNAQANRLAHFLRKKEIGEGSLVAICMDRSIELMVGILGVMKAGAAYLPIDPDYPQGRVDYLLHDSGAQWLLTQDGLKAKFESNSVQAICLDTDWNQIQMESDQAPNIGVKQDDLVYVIYTSGSTGKPKGVMIEHAGLMNYLHWAVDYYETAMGNGSAVHSSIAFDLIVSSLFAPLLAGKQVVLVPEHSAGAEQLKETLLAHRDFAFLKMTPAHLQLLSQQLLPQEAAGLARVVATGGEALTQDHVAFWLENAPQTKLFNVYGPTETVVGCCAYEVTGDDGGFAMLPIGRPIANTQMYVLDQHMQPVPIGVTGELYIGGRGVARGYLNQPELTREKFVEDVFSEVAGARLYKTGDVVRYRGDGNLHFIGRTDDQVKVRGYRIELGEIEAVLSQHPAVQEAAVRVLEERKDDKRLVAYIVPSAAQEVDQQELLQELRRQLPAYMVPSVIVKIDSLPITPHGKVDRNALPVPNQNSSLGTEYQAPANPVEEVVAGIFAETLGVERMGMNDHFFERGGHSLLATQLISYLREAFQVDLPLLMIFEGPTPAQVVAAIMSNQKWREVVEEVAPLLLMVSELQEDEVDEAEVGMILSAKEE